MEFFNYNTVYSGIRRNTDKNMRRDLQDIIDTPQNFYKFFIQGGYKTGPDFYDFLRQDAKSPEDIKHRMRSLILQATAELEWYNADQPYFKIHPSAISVFSKCPINIPGVCLFPPFNLPAVVYRFPSIENGNSLILDDGKFIRSILLFRPMFHRLDSLFTGLHVYNPFSNLSKNRLFMWCDTNDWHEDEDEEEDEAQVDSIFDKKSRLCEREPKMWHRQLFFDTGESVEDAVEKRVEDILFLLILRKCIAQILGVHGLAERNDSHLLPEVMSKDRTKFGDAKKKGDLAAIYELQNKAKRRGNFGWQIAMDK